MTVDVLPTADHEPLRILAVSNLWQGANDYAFVRAFRRAGHSVRVVNEKETAPVWKNRALRLARKVFTPQLAKEFNNTLLREAEWLQPDLLFVFKGPLVQADTLRHLRRQGVICIQYYPDVSFRTHGPYLPDALREYDWNFSTKSFGLKDMAEQLGITNSSFLPHAFDPETHFPTEYSAKDETQYGCDISFIGNHSAKKQRIIEDLLEAAPELSMKIWGTHHWSAVPEKYQGHPVLGLEYSKAIRLSKINLALLSEQRAGASSGDLITARTFEIPGAGGFMMHERTTEAEEHFTDGEDCAFFENTEELVSKIRHYLAHADKRQSIAAAGRQRSLDAGYSTDDRAQTVIAKFHELKGL